MATERLIWKGIDITIERTADGHLATAVIPTRAGAVVYKHHAHVPPEIWAWLQTVAPDLPATAAAAGGDFFSDLSRGFSQMTKSQAFSDITRTVSDVASNPLFTAALGVVVGPGAVPIAGVIGTAAKAAHSLSARAKRGDPAAVRAVGGIARAARRGDPKAQRAARMIQEASRQQRQTGPRLDAEPEASPLGGLGDLAGAFAHQVNPMAYAAMVDRYQQSRVIDTVPGPDGAYEVAAGAAFGGEAHGLGCGCASCVFEQAQQYRTKCFPRQPVAGCRAW